MGGRAITGIGFALAIWPMATSAQSVSGNDLFRSCTTDGAPSLASFCIGYIIGTWEGINLGVFATLAASGISQPSVDDANKFIETLLMSCPPSQVENSQIRDVSIHYMKNHPEERHESARILIHKAMVDAFPCPSR